jgi:leader peptidase (prepilin peptidase) / N-methyltransferase
MGAGSVVLTFALGLPVGSFLEGVASAFTHRRVGPTFRASCSRCGDRLTATDSLALASYVLRRGRCPHCGARRGLRALLLELTTGGLFVACFAHFGFSGRAFVAAAFCAVLVVLAAIDAERRILPNAIVVPAGLAILVADIAVAPHRWLEWLVAALGAGLVLLALALAYRGGLGMGDVKLGFLLGAGLGKAVVWGIALGFIAAFVPAAYILLTRGAAGRKQAIPLGPFLALGSVIALFVA